MSQAKGDPKLVKRKDQIIQPLKDPKIVIMKYQGHLSFSQGTCDIDESISGEDLHYEPWRSIVGKKTGQSLDSALLPKNLQNGESHSVREKPLTYTLDGQTVYLDFTDAVIEINRYRVKWWGPLAYPFAKITDTGLSVALIGWTITLFPVDLVFDKMLHVPAFDFLWPAPFYNTWRKSKGLRPLKPEDLVPH